MIRAEHLRSNLTGIVCAVLLAFAAMPAPAQSNYLPVSPGKRWVLKSTAVATPMVFEVVSVNGDTARIRWDNPWIPSEFELLIRKERVYLVSLTMGGKSAPMPPETVYWNLGAGDGEKWSSALGNFQMLSRNRTIKGSGQTWSNCLQIRETNKQGQQLFWSFAPGVGFVQFGEGKGAFTLESVSGNGTPTSSAPRTERPTLDNRQQAPPVEPSRVSKSGPAWIGLAANPAANEGFTPKTVKARFEQSLQAGVSYIYISPKWNEVETGKRKYKLNDIDFQIRQSQDYNVPAVLHLRVIDTNQRSTPSDLMGKSFRDPEFRDRLLAAIDAVMDRMKGRVKYMLIGNEIESYFRSHKDEVDDYADLYAQVVRHIKTKSPGMPVSVSIGFDGLEVHNSLLRPLLSQTDFFAITYYGLTPDFRVKDPSAVKGDFGRIISAAGNKPVLLQEVGYPSSPTNNSSEEKQAQFFSNVLDQVRNNSSKVIGANFCFMSDFSDELTEGFVKYYKAEGADRFRAFLKTLGMFDDKGRPKKSWDVFRQRAPLVSK